MLIGIAIKWSQWSLARKWLSAQDPYLGRIAHALWARIRENKQSRFPVNHFSSKKIIDLLQACHDQRWMAHMVADGLQRATDAVAEAQMLQSSGEYHPSIRWKPWGFEVIGPTIREDVDGGEEGYTMKLLFLVGPLSRQVHEDYVDGLGKQRHAKTETQTVLAGTYCLGIGESLDNPTMPEKVLIFKEGQTYHVAAGTIHQPMAPENGIAIVLEVSKPNIGPGSTTRLYDPSERMRKIGDV